MRINGPYRPKERWPDGVTFAIAGTGLGDVWRSVQYACHVNATQGTRVDLYGGWHGWPQLDFSPAPLADRTALIEEILPLLDTPGRCRIARKADLKRVVFTQWFSVWQLPLIGARIRWKGRSSAGRPRLTCQLDGIVGAKEKNPPATDLTRLMRPLPGVQAVALGRRFSVRECLERLADSDLFFGVDSGMMQLAYSVGVPCFLLSYRSDRRVIAKWHNDRHAVRCAGTDEFLHLARAFFGRGS